MRRCCSAESAAFPELALTESAYADLADGCAVDHRVLSAILGSASEMGILQQMRRNYTATACDAMRMPICAEIGRLRPVPPQRQPVPAVDPLTDPLETWDSDRDGR